jgi:Fe-Mn family superoxide dismutase
VEETASSYVLPPLPFAQNALEPVISARTIEFHYGKHHKGYIDNMVKLVAGTGYGDMSLEKIIAATAGDASAMPIFNNTSQAWNHTFYWHCLSPDGGGEPSAELKRMIEHSFGSIDACKKEISTAATGQFGSGWAWLVLDKDRIKVIKTGNADNPLTQGLKPLLTIDCTLPRV